jgi:hypothetical protein
MWMFLCGCIEITPLRLVCAKGAQKNGPAKAEPFFIEDYKYSAQEKRSPAFNNRAPSKENAERYSQSVVLINHLKRSVNKLHAVLAIILRTLCHASQSSQMLLVPVPLTLVLRLHLVWSRHLNKRKSSLQP